jgi:hypothetical protein
MPENIRAVFQGCLHPNWRQGFNGSRLSYT